MYNLQPVGMAWGFNSISVNTREPRILYVKRPTKYLYILNGGVVLMMVRGKYVHG